MLKNIAQAVAWLLILFAACEPLEHESIEASNGNDVGAPAAPPPDTGTSGGGGTVETDPVIIQALAATNAYRSAGCTCGDTLMPKTSEVSWNPVLYTAALAHAQDMEQRNYFSHISPEGNNLYQRLTQAGYISQETAVFAYGENIAFGAFDLEAVVGKWIESPSHCINLMRGAYQEMAIAQSGHYWVQVFGARQD